jgi:hypothetical protein
VEVVGMQWRRVAGTGIGVGVTLGGGTLAGLLIGQGQGGFALLLICLCGGGLLWYAVRWQGHEVAGKTEAEPLPELAGPEASPERPEAEPRPLEGQPLSQELAPAVALPAEAEPVQALGVTLFGQDLAADMSQDRSPHWLLTELTPLVEGESFPDGLLFMDQEAPVPKPEASGAARTGPVARAASVQKGKVTLQMRAGVEQRITKGAEEGRPRSERPSATGAIAQATTYQDGVATGRHSIKIQLSGSRRP